MVKNLYIFIFYMFFYIHGYAQNVYKGRVVNEQGIPLSEVSIGASDGKKTFTDTSGTFVLRVSTPIQYIRFSLIGYKTYTQTVDSLTQTYLEIIMHYQANELGEVVISAGRHEQKLGEVTVSMEIMKPRLIEQTNSVKLDEVMDKVPGVNIVNGQANIRGGSGFSYGAGSRVLLLVDDLPMLSADAADIKWDAIPLENISQVEVIKGASSALFGTGALGGVINLRTTPAGNKPLLKIQVFSSMYDNPAQSKYKYYKGSHFVKGSSGFYSRKIKQLDITAGYYYLGDEGYRQGETYKNLRANTSLRYHFKKVKGLDVGLNGSIFKSDFGNFLFWKNLDSVYWPADGTLGITHTKRYTADPYILYQYSKKLKHSLRGRLFVTDNKNNTNQNSVAYLIFGEYQLQRVFQIGTYMKATTTTGICYTSTHIKSEGFYGTHQGSNRAAFVQVDLKYRKTNVNLGFRQENNVIDSFQVQGFPVVRAGMSQQFFKATFLRASYGTGYRFPSVAERFTSTSAGGIIVIPNPLLNAETGRSSEIGIKQGLKIGKWTGYADVAVFWTKYKQLIDFVFDANYFGFQSKNLGNATINGWETSLAGTGKINKVQLWVTGGYTFIQPNYADTTLQPTVLVANAVKEGDTVTLPYTNNLKYRFRHTWKMNIDMEYKNFNLGATLRYNSYMLNIDPTLYYIIPGTYQFRSTHPGGYYILDLRLSYILKKIHRFSFIVKNVTNGEYLVVPGNMGAQRSFTMQYNLTF